MAFKTDQKFPPTASLESQSIPAQINTDSVKTDTTDIGLDPAKRRQEKMGGKRRRTDEVT